MRTLAPFLLACALLVAGCARPSERPALRVYAAASLQGVFAELADRFRARTGTPVELVLAGSSDLVTQLAHGAPGDVLATADEASMGRAADARLLAAGPAPFATNTLVVAVRPGNPRRVAAYADLTRPGTAFVRCAPQVPCGAAARAVERAAGATAAPVSEEGSVTDVLGKVASGQADAGLVYATDAARAAGRVEAVRLPEADGVVNRYPIAALSSSSRPADAAGFVDLVRGPEGRAALAAAGFGAP